MHKNLNKYSGIKTNLFFRYRRVNKIKYSTIAYYIGTLTVNDVRVLHSYAVIFLVDGRSKNVKRVRRRTSTSYVIFIKINYFTVHKKRKLRIRYIMVKS